MPIYAIGYRDVICEKDVFISKVTLTMTTSQTSTSEQSSGAVSIFTKELWYSEDLSLDQIIDVMLVSDFCSQQVQFSCGQSGGFTFEAEWEAWTGKKVKFNTTHLDGDYRL